MRIHGYTWPQWLCAIVRVPWSWSNPPVFNSSVPFVSRRTETHLAWYIFPLLCEERMYSGLCRHSFFPLLAHLRLVIFVHMVRHIAAIADGPDNERSAAHDVSCRKHAVERGHHGAMVDA